MDLSEEQRAFLVEPHIAVVCTNGPQGVPHAIPTWFFFEDGEVVMIAGRGSQRVRNLERDPAMTVVVDRRTIPYYSLTLSGRASIDPPPTPEESRRMATRYLGQYLGERYLQGRSGEGSVTVRLRPERAYEYRGVTLPLGAGR